MHLEKILTALQETNDAMQIGIRQLNTAYRIAALQNRELKAAEKAMAAVPTAVSQLRT